MIDLTSKALPDTIEVAGEAFLLNTDYRVWLRFVIEFESWDKHGELNIEYLFKDGLPVFWSREDYNAILEFAFPINVVPRGEEPTEKILDYVIDSDYIYSAFMQQYHIDLLKTDMHWHVFKALLNGISSGTKLHEIMGYRSYTGEKIKNQDELYKRLKNAWDLPVEESEEDRLKEEEFNRYFE